jgi:hypothetical protein
VGQRIIEQPNPEIHGMGCHDSPPQGRFFLDFK